MKISEKTPPVERVFSLELNDEELDVVLTLLAETTSEEGTKAYAMYKMLSNFLGDERGRIHKLDLTGVHPRVVKRQSW